MRAPPMLWLALTATLLLILPSCDSSTAFVLERFNANGSDKVALNQPLVFDFSEPVYRWSVSSSSIRIVDRDSGIEVNGKFFIDGPRVTFLPRLPSALDLLDGGLRPGQHYDVEVRGFPAMGAVEPFADHALDRDRRRHLEKHVRFSFQTVDVNKDKVFVDGEGARPLALGDTKLEVGVGCPIGLSFNKPLDPRTVVQDGFEVSLMENNERSQQLAIEEISLDNGFEGAEVSLTTRPPIKKDGRYLVIVKDTVKDLGGLPLKETHEVVVRGGSAVTE